MHCEKTSQLVYFTNFIPPKTRDVYYHPSPSVHPFPFVIDLSSFRAACGDHFLCKVDGEFYTKFGGGYF